jgi:hypothetical protein
VFLACLFLPIGFLLAAQTSKPEDSVFDYRMASERMHQIGDALAAHNQKKMLGAFDLGKMSDAGLFRQQISSFFAQTGSIRVHFNLVEAGTEDGTSVATVDAQMEASLRDESLTPVRKEARLRFVAEKSADGWKFTDVEPRSFFSTQP